MLSERKNRDRSSSQTTPRSWDDESAAPQTHSVPIFVLNRSGMEEDELREAFQTAIDEIMEYEDEEIDEEDKVTVTWVSKFGKYPEQPHALVIISDYRFSMDISQDGTFAVKKGEDPIVLDVDICSPTESKPHEEATKVCVSNVPTNFDPDTLEQELRDFFFPIAEIDEVIIPKCFSERRQVFLSFHDEASAGYVVKVAFFATFHNELVRCSFAKKRKPRKTSSPHRSGRKGGRKNSGNGNGKNKKKSNSKSPSKKNKGKKGHRDDSNPYAALSRNN